MADWFSKTSVRFTAAILVLLLGFGVGLSVYLRAFSEDSYLTRKNELQHIVSLARNVIEPVLEEKKAGKLTIGQARVTATDILNHFVYSDDWGPNFVFLASYEGYILVEPFKPDAVGTYQMQRRDINGTAITQELLQTAKAGGGFVFYHEPRMEGAPPQKKLSYVTGIPELECYIGTGMYVDDIDRSINILMKRFLLLGSFILVIILGLQYYFLHPLLHCFFTLSNAFKEFGRYPASLPRITSQSSRKTTDTAKLIENFQTIINMLKEDRMALKERVTEIQRLAYFDPLTNLPNRASLAEWFQAELERAVTGESRGAIMFLDLNDFKRVNDLFGHSRGDQLLVQTGSRIETVLRDKGRIFRLGGDEFIIIIPGLNGEEAEKLAQEILRETACPYVFQGESFYVTGSLGIARYPEDGCDMDSLLSKVDTAMYYAKEAKMNGYSRFDSSMHEAMLQRIKLENSLAKALERNQLELFYQPQWDVALNKPVAIEALLRWNRSNKGRVFPGDFIPIAEESGLIIPIGRWVLLEACRFCAYLHSLGYDDIYVTVNLSARQAEQPNLVDSVRETLEEAGLEPRFLELEITESLFMNSLESCKDKFRQLRGMGIRLALDDFGTGYSSLTRLRLLPFDVLKIDKEFLREINAEQSEIIRTIIKLAHVLGMEVVVEGVETVEQAKFAADALSDRVQGYYFSQPLARENLLTYMARVY
ncbi:MAG TPA: EAL domain-containing protein [Methylomusa anaerophila]|uniref:Cyclic di-GMP phosphodiesterase Gmr n=1 Tax=Methylomusa anaerophila TaxID=1930071 RepID=A0A348AFP4_9FIRM|nr:EAL domain-containing protein [Methylomusa anaerophila]BBB89892.1 cyclic di-GMP phosphodiesterase Gmr [Methylomusa anaerophila]HML90552.1 EAL domain-containing protein [Methylomusa anaerophila]